MKPEQVLTHWDIPPVKTIQPETNGLLNKTYMVNTADGLYVLQRLHEAVSKEGSTLNYFYLTEYFAREELPTQQFVKTKAKQLVHAQDGHIWRLLKALPGKIYETLPNELYAYEAGKLLGTFHKVAGRYNGPVSDDVLPMFQYDIVIEKLTGYSAAFTKSGNEDVIDSAKLLLEKLPSLLLPKNLPKQLIHADPKASNFIFNKEGKGAGMIDFDTLQPLSPLYDIGDAVRSLCGGKEYDPNHTFSSNNYKEFLKGYRETGDKVLGKREQTLITQAVELIMLGLAARFLNDYIDDSYFGWDDTLFNSRKEHNLARCLGQIALWNSFVKQKIKEN